MLLSMSLRRFVRLMVVAAAMALLVTACGDDDTTTSDDTSSPDNDASADGDSDNNEPVDRSGELAQSWSITTYQLAGAAGEATPVGDAPVTIAFAADGTLTYSTGCNTGGGEWETRGVYQPDSDDGFVEGQSISFDDLFQTEIGCQGELGEQDLAIGGAIRAAELFTLDGGTLTLYRDGNLMIEAVSS